MIKNLLKCIKKGKIWIGSIILLVIVCFCSIWCSYHLLQVNHYIVETNILDWPLHLVVIGDLHDNTFGCDNEDLVSEISSANPAAILIVGDMLNGDSQDAESVYALVKQLSDTYPVYYTLGNHELEFIEIHPEFPQKVQQAGAILVDKNYFDIELGGKSLRIGGLYDYAFALDGSDSTNPETMDPEIYQFLRDFQDTKNYKIMLSHRPESFILGEASKTWEIDLVVSGHVHGGQVVLPYVGGLWAPEQGWFPTYVHGLYEKDKLQIFITSGLGSNKQNVPRFYNPPEIAVLTLT